ncbi:MULTISPECIES: response regulator [Gemmobacter]|uniref:Regulatory protein VirG n=2 Tax=Gemmobacter TaxID=204456 RepID=A0A2T6AFU7_9RHOB|nr:MULTISPECIES: response regulator [Gemmobacter]OJY27918.1 MAG: two-component system response regulator TorR [Rhodobacterales bacterium 65-51]PTX42682.1 two-component system torCAD operon response regulator TorR [Gemmobacter caeni]TWI93542.1 two-component system torCAD operon response regulator TorR [Gemmobacter caeni]GHC38324.1 two-component system response regulator TorR [Gemmobacter nanjingensis]
MTSAAAHIVVIEDDAVTRTALAGYLETFGYRVTVCAGAEAAERVLNQESPDLLIVDINLSGKDGLEITREQRARSEIGIILLSGRTDDVDRIVGLELGADDYVCKPFNRRELLARVKNLLRRTAAMRQLARRVVHFAGFTFDTAARHVVGAGGESIQLTRAEYELLRAFVLNPGIVMNRDRLLSAITHRRNVTSTRTVDVMVKRLREKFGDDPKVPRIFGTSHGEGYVFTAPLA